MIESSSVSAGDYCHAPQYYYKTVTVYETARTQADLTMQKLVNVLQSGPTV